MILLFIYYSILDRFYLIKLRNLNYLVRDKIVFNMLIRIICIGLDYIEFGYVLNVRLSICRILGI